MSVAARGFTVVTLIVISLVASIKNDRVVWKEAERRTTTRTIECPSGTACAQARTETRIHRLPASFERYRVRRGDTLARIAKRRKTSVGRLRAMNAARLGALQGSRQRLASGTLLWVPRD